jgi:hypothetical protein
MRTMTLSIIDRESPVTATRPYLSTSATSLVTLVVLVAGVIAAIAGVAFWVNGLTQARADVTVGVELQQPAAEHWFGADTASERDVVRLPDPGLPAGAHLQISPDAADLSVWDSTLVEQGLARSGYVVLGFGCLVVALLLRPVLTGLERGDPFSPGNARRIAGIAGIAATIVVVSLLVPTLDSLAAAVVLRRLGLDDPAVVTWHWSLPLAPLLVACLVLAVAESFRRGEQLRDARRRQRS